MNFLRRFYRLWKFDRAMFTVLHAVNYSADQPGVPDEAFEILWDTLTEMLDRRNTL